MFQDSRRWLARFSVLVLLLLPSSLLHAEGSGEETQQRVTGYLGFSGSVAFSFDDFGADLSGATFSNPFGFSFRAGLRGNRWAAAEVHAVAAALMVACETDS